MSIFSWFFRRRKRVLRQTMYFGFREWGNALYLNEDRISFHGHYPKSIAINEALIIEYKEEEIESEVFLVTQARFMRDPHDQVFGKVISIGFIPNNLIRKEVESKEYFDYLNDLFSKTL